MAKDRAAKQAKQNLLFIPGILLLWVLVKIGQFQIILVKATLKGLLGILKLPFSLLGITYRFLSYKLWEIEVQKATLKKHQIHAAKDHRFRSKSKKGFSFKLPTVNWPQLHIFSKKRGRPRTQPLLKFYGQRLQKLINKIFPTPLRIGVTVSIIVALLFGYSLFLILIAHDLPNPNRLKESSNPITTELYDRNGKLLYRLYEGHNRTLVKLEDVPQHLINATISIEDKNFFSHPGVDVFGVIRAAVSILRNHQVQGGSTLTQQLIKNTLLTQERTWQRKIQEVLLSFWAERIFSKRQILQMYLNEISYGGPTLGIETAAQTFFGKGVKELDLAESAYLAGLPASPTTFSPYGENADLAKQRQKEVLRRMVEDGYITQQQADAAASEQLAVRPYHPSLLAPHFVMYVRQYLEEKYGSRFVTQGGLKVTTSLDLDLQQAAETIVGDEVAKLANLHVSNGAAMVQDPRTGQILAMVGSKDYYDPVYGNYNVALALRQPGSSIKPITYATAFKFGYSPGTVILDTPSVFDDGVNKYAPVNYDGSFHGPVTIRTALGSSYNIPAVKTLFFVGLPSMLQTARDLGITTLNDINRYGLSLTLGAGEVRLIDLMTVYSTFSQMGIKHYPTPILKITDAAGQIIEDNSQNPGVRVLNPGIAYMITDILADNKARTPAFGPNSLLVIAGHNVPVKTGTTDSKKDNWTFGFTPEYTVGVWVGNNNNTPMDPRLTSGITGASPIWNRIMTYLLKDKPADSFQKPVEVTEGLADGNKDLVLSGLESKSTVAKKNEKKKDKDGKEEKEVITFTDPFSTVTQDLPKPQPANNP